MCGEITKDVLNNHITDTIVVGVLARDTFGLPMTTEFACLVFGYVASERG
jgi:hypothetical protein